MSQGNILERERIKRAIIMITECYDILLDQAPVMLHSIGQDGYLVEVNRLWLTTLGYEEAEVLGRKSVEFLTDES